MPETPPISCKPQEIWENAKKIVQESQINLLGYMKSVLEQCFIPSGGATYQAKGGGVKSGKKKRKPSKYNLFIGSCMRGGGKTMKECAAEYKKQK